MKMYELIFIYEIRVNNVQKEGTSPLTSTSNLFDKSESVSSSFNASIATCALNA